jgi:hypothetical protein
VAEEARDQEKVENRRSLRGIMRWLGRFLKLSAMIIAGTLVLAGMISSIAYLNRARLLNRTLAVLVEPFHVSVGEVHFHRLGEVRISNLRLSPKGAPNGTLLASVPETVITYRFSELRETGKLRAIALRGAEINLDTDLLTALTAPASGGSGETAPFDLSRLAFYTDSFTIREGRLTLAFKEFPRVTADWHFSAGDLDFGESGLSREAINLRLTNVLIGEVGENGRVDRLIASARVNTDLSRFHLSSLHLLNPSLRITPGLFPDPAEPPAKHGGSDRRAADPPASPPAPAPLAGSAPVSKKNISDLLIEALRVDGASVEVTGFDGTGGRPTFPELSFSANFAFQNLSLNEGRWKSDAPLSLSFDQVALGDNDSLFLSAGRIKLSVSELGQLVHNRTVSEVRFEGLDVLVSDNSTTRLGHFGRGKNDPGKSSSPALPWTIEKLTLSDATVLVQNLTLGEKTAPYFESRIEAGLQNLQFGNEGFQSDGAQSIILEQSKLRAPGASTSGETLLAVEYANITGNWSDFRKNGLIDRVVAKGPQIDFTDETLGAWLEASTSPRADQPEPGNRPFYRVAHLDVTGGRLVADSSFAVGKVPKIYSSFSLHSVHTAEVDPYSYHLRLDDFQIRNHPRLIETTGPPAPPGLSAGIPATAPINPLNEGDVFSVKEIAVDFTADQLQRTRRISKLKMSGAILTVGEGLKAITDTGKKENAADAPVDAPVEPAPFSTSSPQAERRGRLPAWLIEEVEITQSLVQFEALIPQVDGLRFAIETRLSEVPLSLDGLLAEEKRQKIELAGIEIKDPYNSFITVAFLPTIFVEFSLAGLARQEIEKIDLIGPSLHVGQGLFWWIDYQRNFREQNEGASVGIEAGVDPDKKPDWIIKTINATAGKIVIAPTGIPIGIVPFPFDATTSMSGGRIELQLTIPDEDHVYRFPEYKVDLYGLTGDVQFNVPTQEIDNNLVQTFTLKRAVWKEHEASDLYITVTFDSDGVYGQFGGASYDGYAQGQFNFYLRDPGKWDAWIAGTGMDTGPLTQVLVPDSFLMEGRVSLNVIAEGRDKVVGETTGEFQTTGPGWFDITKLGTTLENLPPEWNHLKRSLAELSINTLKRFEYDKGAGSLYFQGRVGELNLRFTGDYGSRELNLNLHNQTNTRQKPAARIEGSETSLPPEPPFDSAGATEKSAKKRR